MSIIIPDRYAEVRFKNMGGINVPLQPWPAAFIMSSQLLDPQIDAVVLRPLTLRGLVVTVFQTEITFAWWRLCRLCWRVGFLDADAVTTATEWRLRFWLPRRWPRRNR